jgi:alkylation response protein AidB-like acyl-CoA dehydrogenase
MATRCEAARKKEENAASAYDSGERCDKETGMATYFASEPALENSIEAVRIHGGSGYSTEFNVERCYRDAPLRCIGEGTNEMQRIIIAKQLIARNPACCCPSRACASSRSRSTAPARSAARTSPTLAPK